MYRRRQNFLAVLFLIVLQVGCTDDASSDELRREYEQLVAEAQNGCELRSDPAYAAFTGPENASVEAREPGPEDGTWRFDLAVDSQSSSVRDDGRAETRDVELTEMWITVSDVADLYSGPDRFSARFFTKTVLPRSVSNLAGRQFSYRGGSIKSCFQFMSDEGPIYYAWNEIRSDGQDVPSIINATLDPGPAGRVSLPDQFPELIKEIRYVTDLCPAPSPTQRPSAIDEFKPALPIFVLRDGQKIAVPTGEEAIFSVEETSYFIYVSEAYVPRHEDRCAELRFFLGRESLFPLR